MDRFVRGLFWFGAYLTAVLAPLVAALLRAPPTARDFASEFAVGLGFVAFGVIASEFALVARTHALSRAFGTDLLMLFHRKMGIAALAFVALHADVLWQREGFDPWSSSASKYATIASLALALLVAVSVLRKRFALPYELWQVTHGALALVAAFAMLAHVLAIGRWTANLATRDILCAEIGAFVGLLAHYRLVRPLVFWRKPWRVAANRDEGADTRTLVLAPIDHSGIAFEPGQFVWLITGRSPFAPEQHPITISSSAELGGERSIELSIKALGSWSREIVPKLAVGARVWLDGPFGAFTLDRAAGQGLVMIAGGVGVTPMRSMLESMRDRKDRRPVVLFYATHDRSRAIFEKEFDALERELDLTIVRVHEAPDANWTGERGFVDAQLLRRRLPEQFARFQFFVCGPSAMMDAVERDLVLLGVPRERVHTERFDMV